MKSKNIVILYLILSLIFVFGIALHLNKYSYSGYYTDKIINWLWLGMTIFMIIRFWKRKMIKVYFVLLLATVILSILPMMIPFFAMVYYFSTFDDYQQIQLNNNYRLERTRPGALYKPQIYIYKKEGILEKKVYKTPYSEVTETVLQTSSVNDMEGEKVPIQLAKLVKVSEDSIGIEYQIRNKKQVFYHKKDLD
ncbi:hypothetical protein DRF59_15925 [Chryseobacterium flavum]|uniref:Uncharacterized protein n=1 Tax=Chryseobacterium flavum TaxID=415851 RepID=A0A3D9CI30_9FLAO|nr:hypothetical protein [Chryseobacterium flavum]REC65438.1 hypothetical protein DRF59_15925 [Chryseobacterium flavum]